MAEITTIARPYAEALYSLSRTEGTADRWSSTLAWLAGVCADPDMQALIGNPRVSPAQILSLLGNISGDRLDAQGRQLVQVLVANHRLGVAPAIRDAFEALRQEAEGVMDADVASAFPVSDAQLADLVASLEKRFTRKIHAHVRIAPELIGGVRITLGDVVIDGSIRARLDDMSAAITR